MSRRSVSTCVVCAFALAPAALAADVPGGAEAPVTGGAAAPAPQAPALAPTPAEAVRQVPVASAGASSPAGRGRAPEPVEVAAAPELRPTSAVTAQNDDDVVDVPVPREPRRTAPARAPVAQTPRLPTTGFDLGLFTAVALVMLGTGVGISAASGPRRAAASAHSAPRPQRDHVAVAAAVARAVVRLDRHAHLRRPPAQHRPPQRRRLRAGEANRQRVAGGHAALGARDRQRPRAAGAGHRGPRAGGAVLAAAHASGPARGAPASCWRRGTEKVSAGARVSRRFGVAGAGAGASGRPAIECHVQPIVAAAPR